ncbi:MAG: Rieske 2Fe-2S domain-containing protein [Proteobacteria bacterium]|nr:Rieske 2Fe-2S domain-containing protein [Pseudomonadota bacterium]
MTYNWTTQDLQDLQPRPIELAETIPAKWFTNVDLYQFELNSVFSKSWQYVLPLSSIRNLGDVWAGTLLEKPVLLVKVSSTEHGVSNTRIFRCAYHSWTYDLSGKLVGAPKFDGAQEFEKKTCKLPEYKVEVVYGMIFVNLNENAESMKPLFDKVSSTISPIDMNEMNFYQRVEYKVKCNWKVYIDNYMEGYHISPVHPGLAKILQLDGYKTTIDGPSILQYGPLANENNPYHTAGAAYYYQIFPNLMLNILPGRMQVLIFITRKLIRKN